MTLGDTQQLPYQPGPESMQHFISIFYYLSELQQSDMQRLYTKEIINQSLLYCKCRRKKDQASSWP